MEEFYRRNYRIVFGYLYSLCGNEHLAEDLTSETFLRAIQKIHTYDGRVKASTWLCTIGKNLYRNELKRRKHVNLDDVQVSEGYSMEEQIFQSQRTRQLLELAAKLEEPKNQVFRMRLRGMSFRDIGEALGKNENWARVTFFRAKETILKRMEESE